MGKKKILVLGSTGMAGHMMTTYFEENGTCDVFNLAHKKKFNERTYLLDVTDFVKFETYLDEEDFDIIINCIGILNQYADASKDKVILINSYLPHFLEEKFRDSPTKIIHISTDCVFSGKTGFYTEKSFRDGDSYYDRTKAIGEIIDYKNLTIRTSIIGPDINYDGIGLFNWFMKSKGKINGYANAIWTGVTTIELAKAVEKAIAKDISGLYHLVNGKSINKYELLLLFQDIFSKNDVNIAKYDNEPIDKSLINTRHDFDYKVPDYKVMISEMREWILSHSNFYPHYTL